jgi:hypothetical protein
VQSFGAPGRARPLNWSTFVTAGPTLVGNRFGGEVSVVRVTFDRHLSGGGGLVTGADRRTVYGELEGILIYAPHDEAAATLGHEYPLVYVTGGLGPVARWDGGAPGFQATVSLTALLPLTVVARAQRFFDGSGVELTGGLMLKAPVVAWW